QREQELLAQKQAAQEKEKPPNSDFRQLIEEMCGTKVCEEQKKKMEDTMLELLDSKLLLIKLNSQHLNKEEQEVKNIAESAAKRQTRITPCLKNFKVIHKESIIPLNKTPQISSVNAITPDLPTVEPDNSLSMGDEHLSTIPEMETDEVIKSSVENLVPIPSEFEGISDDTCDMSVCEDSSTFDALKDHSEILSDDGTSSDDDDFEDIEYVDASPPDSELVSLEEVNVVDQEKEEIDLEDILQIQDVILREKLLNINRLITNIESLNDNSTPDRVIKSPSPFPIPIEDSDFSLRKTSSGSTTTHANNSLPEYDLFHFEIEPDQDGLTSVVMEDILGEPRVHVPNVLPTHPTLMMDSDVIIRTFLPYFTYPIDSSFPLSFGSEDTIFDPGISTFHVSSLKPVAYENPMVIFLFFCFCPKDKRIRGESS
ncbi:hypothetical protein Tco_1443867, partial [Tanacetum coccineum]